MTSTTPTRKQFSLGDARREFVKHPTPWVLLAVTLGGVISWALVGGKGWGDLLVVGIMIAAFPFYEWIIHVMILHWRPKKILGLKIDSLLARKHREHHSDPKQIDLIFIPTQTIFWLIPGTVAISVFAFPSLSSGLTYLAFAGLLGLNYEWIHFLVHTDYKPKRWAYRAVYRNHRNHHFKNEHYWFSVTSSGISDRVLGTFPDPASVPTSPTAKALHAGV